MNVFLCDKCFEKIKDINITIKNNKLVCPYCNHTIETDKFKVQKIRSKQEKEREADLYENKSTDK